jgi:hypothetical protein
MEIKTTREIMISMSEANEVEESRKIYLTKWVRVDDIKSKLDKSLKDGDLFSNIIEILDEFSKSKRR